MTDVVVKTPMQYLDKAVGALRDMGVMPSKTEDAPITGLLEQTAAMQIGQRYQDIAQSFNSIRDDAKKMVDQMEDGKIDILERATNVWMKISRGDIPARFDKIKSVYLDVTKSTKDQIQRENT